MQYRPEGIPYGPLRTELGGTSERIILEAGSGHGDPVLAANAALLEGNPERAIAILNQDGGLDPARPANGGVLTDLAVAHAMLAERTGSRAEFEQALRFCETALSLNPADLAAQFNRALILERLDRIPEARAVLQRFIERESDPGWRGEAEHILRGL
jgi:tetratricopeptide (TPR) repeat protein